MVCLGGYWFWFFIRVDVAAEGKSPFRMCARSFIVSLVLSVTFGLVWAIRGIGGTRPVDRTSPGPLSHCHGGAVRIDPVVEVLAHVLQAGRSAREASIEGQRFCSEFADADP